MCSRFSLVEDLHLCYVVIYSGVSRLFHWVCAEERKRPVYNSYVSPQTSESQAKISVFLKCTQVDAFRSAADGREAAPGQSTSCSAAP